MCVCVCLEGRVCVCDCVQPAAPACSPACDGPNHFCPFTKHRVLLLALQTELSSESRRQYAANACLLSPQLIKTESSLDLSGPFRLDLGLCPERLVWMEEGCWGKPVHVRENGEMDGLIYGYYKGIETRAGGGWGGGGWTWGTAEWMEVMDNV